MSRTFKNRSAVGQYYLNDHVNWYFRLSRGEDRLDTPAEMVRGRDFKTYDEVRAYLTAKFRVEGCFYLGQAPSWFRRQLYKKVAKRNQQELHHALKSGCEDEVVFTPFKHNAKWNWF